MQFVNKPDGLKLPFYTKQNANIAAQG